MTASRATGPRFLAASLAVAGLIAGDGRAPAVVGAPSPAARQSGGGEWPSFRGLNASGVAEGYPTPTRWDATRGVHLAWKTPIPGLAHSSPVVWGDRVFVTTAVSSDPKPYFRPGLYGDVDSADESSRHSWRVYALDRRTGKVLWERTAYEGVPRIKRHIKSSHANSTPVTDGRRLVALFGSEGLYCYDLEGKLLWKQDLGVLDAGWFYDPSYQWAPGSSPVIYGDLVIVQADIQKGSFIAAYDLKDGRRRWITPREEIPSWGTPTVVDGPQGPEVVTNATRRIRGYDPLTGAELWRLSGNSEITAPTPVAALGLVFVTSGYRPIQPIYAIRPGGRGDISLKSGQSQSDHIAWSRSRGGPYMPTPLVYGDHLYTLSNNGVLTCYKAASGEEVYKQRVVEGQGGAYSASPVATNGKLYLSSEDGDIHVVRAGPVFQLMASNPMGEVLMASPALSRGALIVRGLHHVFAIEERPAIP